MASKPESKKKPTGAPSKYTPELGESICEQLIQIGSLRKVCEQEGMPDKATVFRWLLKAEGDGADPEFVRFRDQYTRARQLSKDYKFDEHWEDLELTARVPVLIDDVPLIVDGKVVTAVTPQSVQLARLKHDAFKWQAGKENPKKYGDKVDVNHSGKVGLESLVAGAGDEPESD